MLLPTLSVTAIGVVVGLAAAIFRGRPLTFVVWSAVGAWFGFLLGAIIGVAIDVATAAGSGVVIAGHLAALVGAVVAANRSAHSSGTVSEPDRRLTDASRSD